jgi:hypothetical protein
MEKEIKSIVEEVLEKEFNLRKIDNTYYEDNIYAESNDTMDTSILKEILLNMYPKDRYNELMLEWYCDNESEMIDEYVRKVSDALEDKEIFFNEEELEDDIKEMVNIYYPYDHFDKQKVNIVYSLNEVICNVKISFENALDLVESEPDLDILRISTVN